MVNIFFGLLLVFFRINLNFVDLGFVYYLTNIIGFVSLFFGLKELARENHTFNKIQPVVIFMICHSLLFFTLNISGNSPLTMALTTNFIHMISVGSMLVIIAGHFIIFFIIHLILKEMSEDKKFIHYAKSLESTYNMVLAFFLLAAVSVFILPLATKLLTAISLIAALFFSTKFYTVFCSEKESIV